MSLAIFIALFLAGCFLLANDFVIGGVDLAEYSSWHSYLFLLLGCILALSYFISQAEKRAWRRIRNELLAEMEACQIDKYELITTLEDPQNDAYEEVLPKLKSDAGDS